MNKQTGKQGKPHWYAHGAMTTYSKEHGDPEITCWHCKRTFLCDPMDACCRLCGAPYDKSRCAEFKFMPKLVGLRPKSVNTRNRYACGCGLRLDDYWAWVDHTNGCRKVGGV